uniref:Protocadherin gamma-C3 n=1 Tax=Terrapene triunguis TaxID=2587831 RepID=A0A674JN50_9SAUR
MCNFPDCECRGFLQWQVGALLLVFFPLRGGGQAAQIRYSIPEELAPGSFVGDVARDLGLDAARVASRQLQILPGSAQRHFRAEAQTGVLVVEERIDRERLCGSSPRCLLYLEILLANPLASHRVEVEVLDVNDNAPAFLTSLTRLEIAESAAPGARFPLEPAEDLDFGANSVSIYRLSPPGCFTLSVKNLKDGRKHPELVLEKALDREQQEQHRLVLTALDGGLPAKSGTAEIVVSVIDANDNPPVFGQPVYKITLLENAPEGTMVIKLNATDQDEGTNGEIAYSFSSHTRQKIRRLFSIQERTGEVRVLGNVDYEEGTVYEIDVRAKDKGSPSMDAHCSVLVEIKDVNDNAPSVRFTLLSATVREDAPVGTAVALLSVSDGDSRENGEVQLQLPADIPFQIVSSFRNHYSLVTSGPLDREEVSEYKVVITATDSGSPPLSSQSNLLINISDLNDNPPRFSQPAYQAEVPENNALGVPICSVSAFDPDLGPNSQLSYSIVDSTVQGLPVSSYVYVSAENGTIYSSSSFDHEQIKQIVVQIQARDGGSPPLSTNGSNVTVYVFILDQNDNAPVILHPVTGSQVAAPQRIPQSVPAGYMVTKVTAVDADSGHNAWLSYSLLPQSTDPSLFRVASYTGEIRTTRGFQDTDLAAQKIVVLVKDNGDPALSCTVTIMVSLEDKASEENFKSRDFLTNPKDKPDLTLYLIIALVAVSMVCLVTFIVFSAKCLRKRDRYSCCCLSNSPSRDIFKHSSPKLQLNTDGTLKYMEVTLRPTDSQSQCYRTCFSPGSDRMSADPFLSVTLLQIHSSSPSSLSRHAFFAVHSFSLWI